MRALEGASPGRRFDPLEGVILHEPEPGAEPAAEVDQAIAPAVQPRPAQAGRGIGAVDGRLHRHIGDPASRRGAHLPAAVVWLDVFWVRFPEELHGGDIALALRKRSWLNAFVAAGALGAAILPLFWVHSCARRGLSLAVSEPFSRRPGRD